MHYSGRRMGSLTSEAGTASRRALRTGQLCVRIVRAFPSPPFVLFRAWTTPSMIKKWFHTGPEWSTPAAEVDLQVGGHYRIAMQDAAGKTYCYSGRYQEVREPQSLAFTWAPYGDAVVETLVVLQFRPSLAGSGTELELSHHGLLHEQMRDDHEAVWNICLDRLEEAL
jgi:uncharacterized protein YndB with AHSA1/START domain